MAENTNNTTTNTDINLIEQIYDKVYNIFDEDDIVQSVEEKSLHALTLDGGTANIDGTYRKKFFNGTTNYATISTLSGNPADTHEYAEYLRYRSILFNGGNIFEYVSGLGDDVSNGGATPDIDGSTFIDVYNATNTNIKWYVIDLKRNLLYDGIDIENDVTISRTTVTDPVTDWSVNLNLDDNLTEYTSDYQNSNIGKIYKDGFSDSGEDWYIIPKLGLLIVARDITDMEHLNLSVYENVTSLVYFCRLKNKKFNFTNNPSWVDENHVILSAGNPTTYVTSIGLYNDSNELLAIAKLNKPVKKSFSEELLLRTLIKY